MAGAAPFPQSSYSVEYGSDGSVKYTLTAPGAVQLPTLTSPHGFFPPHAFPPPQYPAAHGMPPEARSQAQQQRRIAAPPFQQPAFAAPAYAGAWSHPAFGEQTDQVWPPYPPQSAIGPLQTPHPPPQHAPFFSAYHDPSPSPKIATVQNKIAIPRFQGRSGARSRHGVVAAQSLCSPSEAQPKRTLQLRSGNSVGTPPEPDTRGGTLVNPAAPLASAASTAPATPNDPRRKKEQGYLDEIRLTLDDQKRSALDGTWRMDAITRLSLVLSRCSLAIDSETKAFFGGGEEVIERIESDPTFAHPLFYDLDRASGSQLAGITVEHVIKAQLKAERDCRVQVQVPSRSFDDDSFQDKALSTVQKRLRNPKKSTDNDAWNLLDFHPQDNFVILPSFLKSCADPNKMREGFDLLDIGMQKLGYLWAEAEKKPMDDRRTWATIGEINPRSAALTAPHIDVDGMDTILTVVQGRVGFMYPEDPTREAQAAFYKEPAEGIKMMNWRLKMLCAGEGVFLPAGCIHAVVRLPGSEPHTLIFGGRVLRQCRIAECASLCAKQLDGQNAVNEDPNRCRDYLACYGRHIHEELQKSDGKGIAQFGGAEEVRRFWEQLQHPQINLDETLVWTHEFGQDQPKLGTSTASKSRPARQTPYRVTKPTSKSARTTAPSRSRQSR